MPDLQWISTDLRTGEVIADLGDLKVESISAAMTQYQTTTATLPLPTAPSNWQRAIMGMASVLVLLQDEEPIWGGIVTQVEPPVGDEVDISLATIESYMDSRYIGDVTFSLVGQLQMVEDLVTTYIADGPNGGLPIRVEKIGDDTYPRDKTYSDSDDKSVYSALTDLAGIINGPEWLVSWEWSEDHSKITPVLKVANHIGDIPADDLAPNVTFEMPGRTTDVEVDEDYTAGKYANDVMAVSTADGDVRPQSSHHVYADPIRPTIEMRFTPSTSIKKTSTLDGYAAAALAAVSKGTKSFSFGVTMTDSAPVLGRDWDLGDIVGLTIGAQGEVPGFPQGLDGRARVIGWKMELKSPIKIYPVLTDTIIGAGSPGFGMPAGESSVTRSITDLGRRLKELGPSVAKSFASTVGDLRDAQDTIADQQATLTDQQATLSQQQQDLSDAQDTLSSTVDKLNSTVAILNAVADIQYDDFSSSGGIHWTSGWYTGSPQTVTITSPTGRVEIGFGGSLNNGSGYFCYQIEKSAGGTVVSRSDVFNSPGKRVAVTGGASFAPSGHNTVIESVPKNTSLKITLQCYADSNSGYSETYWFGGSIFARVAP